MNIRGVVSGDLERILGVADRLSLANAASVAEAEANGFLVSEFSLDDYRRFLAEAEHFFVAEQDG